MTLKQLISLENKATEVWVVSPVLQYDTQHDAFSEIVSVNLNQKTKYRYIVPATPQVLKNLQVYKKKYNITEREVAQYFLLLPPSEFTPFMTEVAIYNASTHVVAVAAPATGNNQELFTFGQETTKALADHFVALWKKYKRSRP